jgi:uncharacterized protein (TIGR02444 family)
MSAAWAFAEQAWRRPGVEAVALSLQNGHGYPPALLLWRLWTLEDGGGVDDAAVTRAVKTARAWEAAVLVPLRRVRRRLRSPTGPITEVAAVGLSEQILTAELSAERALLAALEGLADGRPGPPADPVTALAVLADLWRPPPPMQALRRLVDLIGQTPAPARADPAG